MVRVAGRTQRECGGIVRGETASTEGRRGANANRWGWKRRAWRKVRWKAHDSRAIALSWRSYGGRNGESAHLTLWLHEVRAVGRAREGKSGEPLLRNKVDVRHDDGRAREKGVRIRDFGMRETESSVWYSGTDLRFISFLFDGYFCKIGSFSRFSCRTAR